MQVLHWVISSVSKFDDRFATGNAIFVALQEIFLSFAIPYQTIILSERVGLFLNQDHTSSYINTYSGALDSEWDALYAKVPRFISNVFLIFNSMSIVFVEFFPYISI